MKRFLVLFLSLMLLWSFNVSAETAEDSKIALAKFLIESVLEDGCSYCKVEGDSTGFMIDIAIDGLAQKVQIGKIMGYDETHSDWVKVREAMLSMYASLVDCIESIAGIENPNVMLTVFNDVNTNNIAMMIHKGIILYDVMEFN